MNDVLFAFLLTLFAGLATGIGGAVVLFTRQNNMKFLSLALGFSAGVMIFISFVEIFDKAKESLEYEYGEGRGFLFASIAFFVGIALTAMIDKLLPHHEDKEGHDGAEIDVKPLERTGIMSALAITLHNFPEGFVTFMAAMHDPALGVVIAAAIAIHNIPEGIAISAPIYYATGSKKKAILLSFGSGLTEPLGALAAYFLLYQVLSEGLFGIIFAGVGGMMVFISFHQLLPAAHKYGEHHHIMKSLFAGMIVMAISLVVLH